MSHKFRYTVDQVQSFTAVVEAEDPTKAGQKLAEFLSSEARNHQDIDLIAPKPPQLSFLFNPKEPLN